MAVYTQVTEQDLVDLLNRYSLGSLKSYQGISGGIENSNFFVSVENQGGQSEYVLTLFEELSYDELHFFVQLGHWFRQRRIPVPYGLTDRTGNTLQQVCGKPALLQPRFAGGHLSKSQISAKQCAAIGAALARFHIAGQAFPHHRQAHRGVYWWRRTSESLYAHLSANDAALLRNEVYAFDQVRERADEIPSGIVHGDLFLDNALFARGELSAILDIYNAASGFFLYDLAIVANDWCTDEQGEVRPELEQALLEAYARVRPFVPIEHQLWPQLTCTAAMRFWLSRLEPWIEHREKGSGTKVLKDPDEFRTILLHRRATPTKLPE